MSYIDGFVIAVPTASRQKFIDHAERIDSVFIELGAVLRLYTRAKAGASRPLEEALGHLSGDAATVRPSARGWSGRRGRSIFAWPFSRAQSIALRR